MSGAPGDLDRERLSAALALAAQSIGLSDPNPRVGCVLADAGGAVIGQGFTQRAGGPHAEVMALRAAREQGADVRGGTAWVTLEPCAHHGRTPPCCDALIDAGLARVVVAVADPFPAVNGAGIARLRAAGIQVDMAAPDLADAARDLNIGFFARIGRGRPWVRLKLATTLDGCMAQADGRSQWITGAEARADGHAWRRRAQAIVTGVGTVLADDPRLDVREVPTACQPLRVVLDPKARTPPAARVYQPPGHALRVHAGSSDSALPEGCADLALPDDHGRIDLRGLMAHLASLSVNEVHVEAGPTLSAAVLDAGLVDECLLYLAPRFLGAGRRLPLTLAGDLGTPTPWQIAEQRLVGPDLLLRLRRAVS